jgi:hypothetical protein
MNPANDSPVGRPRRRGPGKPFPKGENQAAKYAATRLRIMDEVIADLEAGGRKVTSADKLLVARYVELIRSRSHSDTNTALKVWSALAAKYAGKDAPNMTAFDRYVAELSAKKDTRE